MRRWALVMFLILPGLAVMLVCGCYLLPEWSALNATHVRLEGLIAQNADLRRLFIVDAQEDLHRINAFAEGVGFLLGALLAGLGVHGLCVISGTGSHARSSNLL
ncbi:MAG TPA: hypothetical protein VM221_14425 [Armatimonadota bacterium]|nr:hypothetical protein [Armatimonadota bacterium]